MKRVLFFVFGFFLSFLGYAQMTVSNSAPNNNVNYLVNNQLISSSTNSVATNINYSGLGQQIGVFTANGTNLGMSEGIVMSTGGLTNPLPSSNDGDAFVNTNNRDVDLAKLLDIVNVSNDVQRNTIVLEFDFIAGQDEVEFEYIFASDEYEGYTCSDFTDVFGFFISGPGISGPYSNGGRNIALVPNPANPTTFTNTPVMINTLNSGTTSNNSNVCSNIDPNWTSYNVFFIKNSAQASVGFNGFTKPLKAKATVQCGKKYHIKLAICDVGDQLLNSAVFLKKGSFNAGTPLAIGIGGQTDFVICEDDITIDPQVTGGFPPVTYEWKYQGNVISTDPSITTSQIGDYKLIVSDVCGSKVHNFTVSPYEDMVLSVPDTVVLCSDTTLTPDITGGAPLYNYEWKKDGANVGGSGPLTLLQGSDGNYSVKVTDNCGFSASDEFYVFTPEKLKVEVTDELFLCEEENKIEATVTGGYGNVVYYWLVDGKKTNELFVNIPDTHSGNIYFIAYDDCGNYFNIEVQVFSPSGFTDLDIEFNKTDFVMCTRDKKALPVIVSGGVGGHTVKWTVDGIMISETPNFVFDPSKFSLGIHQVNITAVDKCDNTLSEDFTLTFSECEKPNVFSPTGEDGKNDHLYFQFGDFQKNVVFRVYNRWGMEVFGSDSYERCSNAGKQNCWDGTNSKTGKMCTQGTYFYIIEFEDGKTEKGSVTVF
jgi:hypothetical protein